MVILYKVQTNDGVQVVHSYDKYSITLTRRQDIGSAITAKTRVWLCYWFNFLSTS
jgi:hypothetical protein